MFPFKVVQLLAEMSEQVGPSCFKNTSHILQFAQVKDQFNQTKCDVRTHSHRAKRKAKMFKYFSLICFAGSLIFFTIAFAFTWCEWALTHTFSALSG